jgi:hypothetical protein
MKCKASVQLMLEKEDISDLCKSFTEAHKDERGVRDVIQGEVTFQEVVFNRLLLSRKSLDKVYSEYNVDKLVRESTNRTKKKSIDIVYTDYDNRRRFCFELKNLRIQDLAIGISYSTPHENYDKLKELSDNISGWIENQVLMLNLRPINDFPYWFEGWGQTVAQFMDNICEIVKNKYKNELQKDDAVSGKSLAWVVVRIGLGRVIYKRVF